MEFLNSENQIIKKLSSSDDHHRNNDDHFSNFSIDHILNRAGEKYSKVQINLCEKFEYNSKVNLKKINNEDNRMIIPIFDWLNYTRYKPPKIQRPCRSTPIKRTPGRLPRVPFTPAQLNALECSYKASNYLSAEEANKLAIQLELTNTRVKIWFQNRRARERREKRETEMNFNNVSSSSSSLGSEHEFDTIDIEQ